MQELKQWESAARPLFCAGGAVEEPGWPGHGLPPGGGGRACPVLAQGYEAEQAGVRLVRLEESWQLVSAPQWGETIPGPAVPGASRTSSRRRPWRPWRWWRIFSR